MFEVNKNTRGILCALSGFSFFAFADASYKYLGQDLNPFEIGFWTQLFGLVVLTATAFFFRLSLKTYFWKLQLLRSVLLAITYYSIIYAFQHLSLAEAYSIFYVSPFLVALMSVPLLGETIGKHRLISILIGFAGVLIILRPGIIPIGMPSIAVLICSLAFALVNILSRKIGESEPALAFSFYPTLFICVTFGLVNLFLPTQQPSLMQFALLAFGGTFESFGALLVAQAFVLTHAVTAMKFSYFNMLWAILLGYLIFGDGIDVWTLTGAAVIIGSGLYLANREHAQGKLIPQTNVLPPHS